ncbi:hypothetical protein J2X77_002440 [Sphingobacterium sp. 2149]|nr:hypothetical protein [Sphingobacterium sp. 2149]
MFKFYQTIVSIILLSVFFSSRDYIAAGSNLMAERYEFDITQDSFIKKITAYNKMNLQDSLFKNWCEQSVFLQRLFQ